MSHKPQQASQRARALEMLAGGARDVEVAAELGVRRETVWRWRTQDPAFAVELERIRRERLGEAQDRLDALAIEAVDVLAQVMRDVGMHGAVRVRAATTILERASWIVPQTRPLREMAKFLDALQRRMTPVAYEEMLEAINAHSEEIAA